jgi:hypothetical protein
MIFTINPLSMRQVFVGPEKSRNSQIHNERKTNVQKIKLSDSLDRTGEKFTEGAGFLLTYIYVPFVLIAS